MATTQYSWPVPTPNGDSGAWGTILNSTLQLIDTEVDRVKDLAEAALPRAGGSMTGEIDILTARYTVVNPEVVAGVLTLDLDLGNFFHRVMTGNTTVAFSNVPASGDFVGIILEITGVTGGTLSWPASVKWPNGLPPSNPGNGEVNFYTLFTRDGGFTWHAARAIEDSS